LQKLRSLLYNRVFFFSKRSGVGGLVSATVFKKEMI